MGCHFLLQGIDTWPIHFTVQKKLTQHCKATTLKENKEGAGDLPLCLPLGSRKRARAHTQICGCHKPGREAPPETSRAGSLISAAQPLSTVRKNAAVFGLWFLAAPAKAAEKSLRAVGARPAGSG